MDDKIWAEKEEYQFECNKDVSVNFLGYSHLDPDLFSVILAINRLPFAYTIPMSCSGSALDHKSMSSKGGFANVNIYTDMNGRILNQTHKQGYFCARMNVFDLNFQKFKEILYSEKLVFDEIPFDQKNILSYRMDETNLEHKINDEKIILDSNGKAFKITHYYEQSKNMTLYWLNIARLINEFILPKEHEVYKER